MSAEKEGTEESQSSQEEPPDPPQTLEHYRLAGMTPLKTLFYLSSGPIIAQVAGALKGIVSTVWISASLGEIALAAISTIGVFDSISRSFGFFISSAGSSKISQLYGQHRESEASQVLVDLIRVSIIMGIIVPAILSPVSIPMAKWLGASDEVAHLCYIYMLPINIMTFSTILFIGLGGCLQGEGRSMFFSILNMVALIINVIVFDPMFLLGFKSGIWGASFGQAFAEFVPFVIIFVMYFMGKFAVKPKFSQFFKPFSPHTLPSLSVGFSQLLVNLSILIPAILVRKFIGLSYTPEKFEDAMSGYNTAARYAALGTSVLIAMTMGYLPAASYAYASKDLRRWLWLTWHCNWTSFVWSVFVTIIMCVWPRQLSMLFGRTEGYLKESTQMLFIGNILGFIQFVRYVGIVIPQSLQMGRVASVLSFLSLFVSMLGFTCLMYFTDKHNGPRILWCYGLSYVFGLVLSIIVLIPPFSKIIKSLKKNEEEDQEVLEQDQDIKITSSHPSSNSGENDELDDKSEDGIILPGENNVEEL